MTSSLNSSFQNYFRRHIATAVGVDYHERNPERRLFELLNIENDHSGKLTVRNVVEGAVSSHMDPEKPGSEQMENLVRLEQELRRNSSSLFATEQKAWLTYRLALYLHGERRRPFLDEKRVRSRSSVILRKAPQSDQCPRVAGVGAGVVIDLTDDSDDEVLMDAAEPISSNAANSTKRMIGSLNPSKSGDTNAQPLLTMRKPALRLNTQSEKENMAAQTYARTAASQRGQPGVHGSNPYGHRAEYITPLQPVHSSPGCCSNRPTGRITDSESNPSYDAGCPPEVRQSQNKAQDDTSIFVIKTFLSSCDPPMDHLLSLFTKAGCVSGAYLQSIAKRSPEQREGILRRILELPLASRPQTGDHGGVSVSSIACDIDVWLLDLHLSSYAFQL